MDPLDVKEYLLLEDEGIDIENINEDLESVSDFIHCPSCGMSHFTHNDLCELNVAKLLLAIEE